MHALEGSATGVTAGIIFNCGVRFEIIVAGGLFCCLSVDRCRRWGKVVVAFVQRKPVEELCGNDSIVGCKGTLTKFYKKHLPLYFEMFTKCEKIYPLSYHSLAREEMEAARDV